MECQHIMMSPLEVINPCIKDEALQIFKMTGGERTKDKEAMFFLLIFEQILSAWVCVGVIIYSLFFCVFFVIIRIHCFVIVLCHQCLLCNSAGVNRRTCVGVLGIMKVIHVSMIFLSARCATDVVFIHSSSLFLSGVIKC